MLICLTTLCLGCIVFITARVEGQQVPQPWIPVPWYGSPEMPAYSIKTTASDNGQTLTFAGSPYPYTNVTDYFSELVTQNICRPASGTCSFDFTLSITDPLTLGTSIIAIGGYASQWQWGWDLNSGRPTQLYVTGLNQNNLNHVPCTVGGVANNPNGLIISTDVLGLSISGDTVSYFINGELCPTTYTLGGYSPIAAYYIYTQFGGDPFVVENINFGGVPYVAPTATPTTESPTTTAVSTTATPTTISPTTISPTTVSPSTSTSLTSSLTWMYLPGSTNPNNSIPSSDGRALTFVGNDISTSLDFTGELISTKTCTTANCSFAFSLQTDSAPTRFCLMALSAVGFPQQAESNALIHVQFGWYLHSGLASMMYYESSQVMVETVSACGLANRMVQPTDTFEVSFVGNTVLYFVNGALCPTNHAILLSAAGYSSYTSFQLSTQFAGPAFEVEDISFPSLLSSTAAPTTSVPSTTTPSTASPSTVSPSTLETSTAVPSTVLSSSMIPSTVIPSTVQPSTVAPSTVVQSTSSPTTAATTIPPTQPTATTSVDQIVTATFKIQTSAFFADKVTSTLTSTAKTTAVAYVASVIAQSQSISEQRITEVTFTRSDTLLSSGNHLKFKIMAVNPILIVSFDIAPSSDSSEPTSLIILQHLMVDGGNTTSSFVVGMQFIGVISTDYGVKLAYSRAPETVDEHKQTSDDITVGGWILIGFAIIIMIPLTCYLLRYFIRCCSACQCGRTRRPYNSGTVAPFDSVETSSLLKVTRL